MPRKPRAPRSRDLGPGRGELGRAYWPVDGGKSEAVSPRACTPQQAREPSLLTPQVYSYPALTETKEPSGGVALPYSSRPQMRTKDLHRIRRKKQIHLPVVTHGRRFGRVEFTVRKGVDDAACELLPCRREGSEPSVEKAWEPINALGGVGVGEALKAVEYLQ